MGVENDKIILTVGQLVRALGKFDAALPVLMDGCDCTSWIMGVAPDSAVPPDERSYIPDVPCVILARWDGVLNIPLDACMPQNAGKHPSA